MQKMNIYIFLLFSFISAESIDDILLEIQNLLDAKSYSNAYELFSSSLKNYDSNSSLYFLGSQLSIKLDDLDAANKHMVKAIELDNNPPVQGSAKEIFNFFFLNNLTNF